MKAIHNENAKIMLGRQAVFNISKIQNESNSQQLYGSCINGYCCVQYIKDTK